MGENVNLVRHDIGQQALIVGDDEERAFSGAQGIDAIGDNLQRINVETAIGFIQYGKARVEHGHLQDFIALLLTTGEADINGTLQHIGRHAQFLGFRAHKFLERHGLDFVLTTLFADRVDRGTQEGGVRHAGNFDRVLEGEEETGCGALFRLKLENILAVKQDFALGYLIFLTTGEDIGEGALAGTVWPHDGVNFALANLEVQTFQDRLAINFSMQVFNLDHRIFRFLSVSRVSFRSGVQRRL